MEIYLKPLSTYCRAVGFGREFNTEPSDLVHGFFASRLANPNYLKEWMASGLRLRQWLRNGFNLYVKEMRRDRARTNRQSSDGGGNLGRLDTGDVESINQNRETEPDRLFERKWALNALESAIRVTRETLDRKGKSEDWALFWSHYIEGKPHNAIAGIANSSPAQVAQRCFGVTTILREALREVLLRDGAKEAEIIVEIRSMMEALHEFPST